MKGKKNKGFASIFFLSVIAIALLFAFFFPRGKDTGLRRASLFSLSENNGISGIVLSREGDPVSIELMRTDGTWKLSVGGGSQYEARQNKIDDFLSALSGKRDIAFVGNTAAEKFGIGIPGSLSVSVRNHRATVKTIRFGKTDAGGDWIYFKADGDAALYRTGSDILPYLDTSAASWTELSILSARLSQYGIQEIIFSSGLKTKSFRAGRDGEVADFEEYGASLVCADITNIVPLEEEKITLIFGNTESTTLGFSPLGDVWILTDSQSGCSYIITSGTKEELYRTLGLS